MTSKNRNFTAEVLYGVVTIKARHPVAKQLFFGWGSDRDPIDASFYGSQDKTDQYARHNFEYARWRWVLNASSVDRMINNIEGHIDDPNYYSKGEVAKARELLDLLKKVEKKL